MLDEARPGRPRTINDDQVAAVIERTLRTTPVDATHWSIPLDGCGNWLFPHHDPPNVLWHAGSAEQEAPYFGSLLEGFKNLGYVDGLNIKFEHRFPNEIPERFKSTPGQYP